MYTATFVSKTVEKEEQRIRISIQFTDGIDSFVKDFLFALDVTLDQIKSVIKDYKQRLEASSVVTLPVGEVDLNIQQILPTQNELDRQQWMTDWHNLKVAKQLADHGAAVLSGTQLTALQTKVTSGFKPGYAQYL